jgi:hypothetical protein
MTTYDEMAADICEISDVNHLNMIMIPWQHPRDANLSLDYSGSFQHHYQVVRRILRNWAKNVAVVLDRGSLAQTADCRKILVGDPRFATISFSIPVLMMLLYETS